MGIFSWIILGLIAGALAKWILPGKDPGGIFVTMAIGIGGAFVGGFLGSFLGKGPVTDLSIGSVITAMVGALVLLYLYRLLRK